MVDRQYLPMSDAWDDHAPGTLTWLQAWYAMHCDGDWEHGSGIAISTIDNPGWRVVVDDLRAPTGRPIHVDLLQLDRSEHDWVHVLAGTGRFEAACGPLNLGEALHLLRLLVDDQPILTS